MKDEERLKRVLDMIETQYYIALDDKRVLCPMTYALCKVLKKINEIGW